MATVPSRADFLIRFPEYNGADTDLIDARLAEAARRTNADIFQTAALAEDAVFLRAACLMLASPHGVKLRALAPDQVFAWEYTLRGLQRAATMGLRNT
jgi:hypothetical protein